MITFDGVIVVEGNTDEALLRTFIDCEIVKTNGSAVTRETISYLKKCSEYREIIVLTDPDFPGNQIRNKISQEVPGIKHAFVPKELSIKHGKVGVAESSKEVIIDALKNLINNSNNHSYGTLTTADLLDLGIVGSFDSQLKRDYLEKRLHIGHTNGKTILKRLNSINISKKELEEIMNESR